MPDHKLRRLIASRTKNIDTMTVWSWAKTSRHLDLIEQQLDWAIQQRNEIAIARLEEFSSQIVVARMQRLDSEMESPTRRTTHRHPRPTD